MARQPGAQQQREDFAPVIHAAANRLYETLREKPVVLNTLRAARATTDLAAIALGLKLSSALAQHSYWDCLQPWP